MKRGKVHYAGGRFHGLDHKVQSPVRVSSTMHDTTDDLEIHVWADDDEWVDIELDLAAAEDLARGMLSQIRWRQSPDGIAEKRLNQAAAEEWAKALKTGS